MVPASVEKRMNLLHGIGNQLSFESRLDYKEGY